MGEKENKKLKKEEVKEKALRYFMTGYNCAESIVKASLEKLNIKNREIEMIATPFGRGIAGFGDICGAASGALLVIGLLYGEVEKNKDRTKCYLLSKQFMDEFEKRISEVDCNKIKKKGIPCTRCIETSIDILFDLKVL